MNLKSITTLLLIALIAFGCQKEIITPDNNQGPELWAGSQDGLFRPDQQCGSSQISDIVDENAVSFGSLEILNDEDNIYLLATMNHGWLLQGVKVYAGNSVNIPKGNGGAMQLEEFPFQWAHSRLTGASTYVISKNGLAGCTDFVFFAQAVQTDMWSNITQSRELWGDGNSVLNGFSANYCQGSCTVTPVTQDYVN